MTLATDFLAERVAAAFNATFAASERTVMVGGAAEPYYLPAAGTLPAQVMFTRDYPASALHEAAHWCLAGAARRRLRDYGYWYQPPPRTPAAQAAFYRVEARVQALEQVFSEAVSLPFAVSTDDLGAAPADREAFAGAVAQESRRLRRAFPPRARRLFTALRRIPA